MDDTQSEIKTSASASKRNCILPLKMKGEEQAIHEENGVVSAE